jgi:CDP-paratose 2-epimerase
MRWQYVDQNRQGDHICYVSNLSKMRNHYPQWDLTKGLAETFREIVAAHDQKQ